MVYEKDRIMDEKNSNDTFAQLVCDHSHFTGMTWQEMERVWIG